ncbi:MAG: UDP binding domain-containing protein [Thiocapsa sp. C3-3m]
MELPPLPPRPGRWPLHRCRPLLPHPQGRRHRLPPRGHPRRAPHQRPHRRPRRRDRGQTHAPKRHRCAQQPHPRPRPRLQGKLPGPAQTRVIDIILALREYNIAVDCYDPWIDPAEAKHEYGLECLSEAPPAGSYDAVILAVAHRDFVETGPTGIRRWAKPKSILYDVKSVLPSYQVDGRL